MLNQLQWSPPKTVPTRRGERVLRFAQMSPEVWDFWRANKDALIKKGYQVKKDDRSQEWNILHWGQAEDRPSAPSPATPRPPVSAPPEMSGFENAAANTPNWPGHEYRASGPDPFAAPAPAPAAAPPPAAPAPARQPDPMSAASLTPDVANWLRHAPADMQLETAVKVMCETIGRDMDRRSLVVALAKVAQTYKEA